MESHRLNTGENTSRRRALPVDRRLRERQLSEVSIGEASLSPGSRRNFGSPDDHQFDLLRRDGENVGPQ